ncbi:hypothetical protein [Streptomyces sp. NPDC015130]|uniref:hypothetical protein n=1 Tax=Streptomyces sp. NPDC015130 TaxID=3364940 RepID=UPI0036F6646A
MPPTAPPKPTTPPADSRSPITVTSVDASHVHLGPEATAGSVTRGELRTFKDYERRLTVRHGDVGKVSDGMRALAQFAEERAAHATRLLEAAKTVKGGNNLGAVLARLEEQAKAQATLAVETLTRAARATDATGALLANVSTRYGGVFQAVVDSDETAPADLHFYKD